MVVVVAIVPGPEKRAFGLFRLTRGGLWRVNGLFVQVSRLVIGAIHEARIHCWWYNLLNSWRYCWMVLSTDVGMLSWHCTIHTKRWKSWGWELTSLRVGGSDQRAKERGRELEREKGPASGIRWQKAGSEYTKNVKAGSWDEGREKREEKREKNLDWGTSRALRGGEGDGDGDGDGNGNGNFWFRTLRFDVCLCSGFGGALYIVLFTYGTRWLFDLPQSRDRCSQCTSRRRCLCSALRGGRRENPRAEASDCPCCWLFCRL